MVAGEVSEGDRVVSMFVAVGRIAVGLADGFAYS